MTKNAWLKKIIFYGSFAALSIYLAEAASFNYPLALINPLMYLAYGLLNVFFLNVLMKWDENKFAAWYLYGFLVGFIIETYVAKTTFYGSSVDDGRFFGVSPGTIVFVIMFFHAYFTFLLPGYLAVKFLKMPFPVKFGKIWDFIIITAPVLYSFTAVVTIAKRGWTADQCAGEFILSGIALLIWMLLLRSQKKIDDVLLSNVEMKILIGITSISYIYFFLAGYNPEHGIRTLPPLLPLLGVSVFTALLLWLLSKVIKNKSNLPQNSIPYDAARMNLTGLGLWFVYNTGIILICVLKHQELTIFFQKMTPTVATIGFFVGIGAFMTSIFSMVVTLSKHRKKME